MHPPVALSIAAHDPLGGAGLAADLTTFAALGVHGLVAITAVTAQRLAAVDRVEPVSADMLATQLDALLDVVRPDAVKVGLLLDADQVDVIASRVADGRLPHPVVDPVMVDGRGTRFVSAAVEHACRELLFPVAAVLTPNRAEAALLAESTAALAELGAGLVVVTGGGSDARERIVAADGTVSELPGVWVDTTNVRGSGCTFAAALTASLALGREPADAIVEAKAFVTARLRDSVDMDLGAAGGVGPISHRFTSGGS